MTLSISETCDSDRAFGPDFPVLEFPSPLSRGDDRLVDMNAFTQYLTDKGVPSEVVKSVTLQCHKETGG